MCGSKLQAAAWLLGIRSPDQASIHALRGGLFEGWVVSELRKARFNRGATSNLFFWRDRRGLEIGTRRYGTIEACGCPVPICPAALWDLLPGEKNMSYFGKLVMTLPDGQKREIELGKFKIALGRARSNDVVLQEKTVSRNHARIEHSEAECVLEDLGSANGTYLNGVRIQRSILEFGDEIRLGDCPLHFEALAPDLDLTRTVLEAGRGQPLDLATLAQAHMTTAVSDTGTDRLTVFTPEGTWEVPLSDVDHLAVGRHSESDLVLPLVGVSRHHARIERRGSDFVIRDLGSSNGTWLGDQRLEEHALRDGDTIRIARAQILFKKGFEAGDLFEEEALEEFASPRPREGERRPIVVIPAMCGSELWRGSDRVWPDVLQVLTDPNVLRLPDETPLEPRAILKDFCIVPNLIKLDQYGRLREFLEESLGYERGRDLLEFPYDWRQDVRLSAQRLARALDEWPVLCKPPVVIIAHSLGCLVARYYVERLGGAAKVSRLLLMGGPHHGVPLVISLVHSAENLMPFGFRAEALREALVTFPAMYQVLPTYACGIDQHGQRFNVLADDGWVPEVGKPILADARKFRRELGKTSSVPTLSIFGYGLKTVTGVSVDRAADGSWRRAEYIEDKSGDHTTPEYSAVFDPDHIHPVQQYHGSLYVDQDVQKRLKLELMK